MRLREKKVEKLYSELVHRLLSWRLGIRSSEGNKAIRLNFHRSPSSVYRVAVAACGIRVIPARNTPAEKEDCEAIRGVASVTWKVYISMSVQRGYNRPGRPFASLPSSLYGSGIAKQVFIARSRRAQTLADKQKRGTRTVNEERIRRRRRRRRYRKINWRWSWLLNKQAQLQRALCRKNEKKIRGTMVTAFILPVALNKAVTVRPIRRRGVNRLQKIG